MAVELTFKLRLENVDPDDAADLVENNIQVLRNWNPDATIVGLSRDLGSNVVMLPVMRNDGWSVKA